MLIILNSLYFVQYTLDFNFVTTHKDEQTETIFCGGGCKIDFQNYIGTSFFIM